MLQILMGCLKAGLMMNLLLSMLKNACRTSQAHICGLHSLILAQFVSAEADGLLDCETDEPDQPAAVDVQISLSYESGMHLRVALLH